eukprot:scaffold13251_cov78-Cyclotella_meneghiniana.AAC.5
MAATATTHNYEPPHFLFVDEPTNTASSSNSNNQQQQQLPTETDLTLLCLDYLRELRRSYTPSELWEAEGLDADYLSLAVWSLSRVFVRPGKLRWEEGRWIQLPHHQNKDGGKDGGGGVFVFGGGGMGEECSGGNDAMYRTVTDCHGVLDRFV